MKVHHKPTPHKPNSQALVSREKTEKIPKNKLWTRRCPRIEKTEIDKRPLAAAKQNKPLSATIGALAKKLRKINNKRLKKLRKRSVSTKALHKKVNKLFPAVNKYSQKVKTQVLRSRKCLEHQITRKSPKYLTERQKLQTPKCAWPPTTRKPGKI